MSPPLYLAYCGQGQSGRVRAGFQAAGISMLADLTDATMRAEYLRFLEDLVNTPSPTGHETRGQRVWLDYAAQFAEEMEGLERFALQPPRAATPAPRRPHGGHRRWPRW